MGQALQVEEEDGLALAIGQAGDGGSDRGGEFGEFRALVRAWLGRHLVLGNDRQFGAQLTQPAPGHIQGDAAEPGSKPVRRAQPVQVGQGGYAGFLRGVPGQVRRPEQPGRERDRGGPVTADQISEGVFVATQRSLHEFRVRPQGTGSAVHTP